MGNVLLVECYSLLVIFYFRISFSADFGRRTLQPLDDYATLVFQGDHQKLRRYALAINREGRIDNKVGTF